MDKTNEGYMEAVTDEELLTIIDDHVATSVGYFLDNNSLVEEREKATLEYAMQPTGHLKPQGVSKIVSSDTVEAVDGYLAVLSELLFNDEKLAKFKPANHTPMAQTKAREASDWVNYMIFKENDGWEILNDWLKSSLLWRTSAVTWRYVEDYEYLFEEYESVTQEKLDLLLSDDEVEIVSDTLVMDEMGNYLDVRLRRKCDNSGVKIFNVPPENLLVASGTSCIKNSPFVGIEEELTRSEIRKRHPDKADEIEWDTNDHFQKAIDTNKQTRKKVAGLSTILDSVEENQEANRLATYLQCWVYVDRDGDGISELKRITKVGNTILEEVDEDSIDVAAFNPIKIPFEFFGLSQADMVRPSTMASTAVLRGFVENVYLTNFAPKLADPSVVDFSALQNLRPKQLVPTIGNPTAAVKEMPPEQISTGTVPLLEYFQTHKEQATGLSKAAQGLNDTLYVSGNSEQKVQQVQSAAQLRLQYLARRFMKTGLKELVEGIYRTARKEMKGRKTGFYDRNDLYRTLDIDSLPSEMSMFVQADVGDASRQSVLNRMNLIGAQILPALNEAGAGILVKTQAQAIVAHKTIEALNEDPLDYLEDYTSEEFQKKALEAMQKSEEEAAQRLELDKQQQDLKIKLDAANVDYTNVQSQNAMQDNLKQLMVSLDKSDQEWAELAIKAQKEGVQMPTRTPVDQVYAKAVMLVSSIMKAPAPTGAMEGEQGGDPVSTAMMGQEVPTEQGLL